MRLTIQQRDDARLVCVAGEIDMATAGRLRDALVAAVTDSREVQLDLRRVSFIDCVGLRAVQDAERAAARSACELAVRPSRAVRRISELVDSIAAGRV